MNLCDTVNVKFTKLGVDVTAKIIKTVYDSLRERYVLLELGDARPNFTDTINVLKKEIETVSDQFSSIPSLIESVKKEVTDTITGVNGGHVYFKLDANNKPQEIYIMDTEDYRTAKKIWRWNLNGFGYSKSGINGPYETAITMDGTILGMFIAALTIVGSQIIAGRIQSVDGKTWFDLDTGDIHFSKGTISAGDDNSLMLNIGTGEFNIQKGMLNAGVITAGRIQSKNGAVYFDLDNSELAASILKAPNNIYGTQMEIGTFSREDDKGHIQEYEAVKISRHNQELGAIYLSIYNHGFGPPRYTPIICADEIIEIRANSKSIFNSRIALENSENLASFYLELTNRTGTSKSKRVIAIERDTRPWEGSVKFNFSDEAFGSFRMNVPGHDERELGNFIGNNDEFTSSIADGQAYIQMNTDGVYVNNLRSSRSYVDSDPDLKTNVKHYSSALSSIRNVNVYKYNLKKPIKNTNIKSRGNLSAPIPYINTKETCIGIMYNEAPKEVQHQTKSGHKCIDLYGLTAMLLSATNELADKVNAMSDEIETLKGMITQ